MDLACMSIDPRVRTRRKDALQDFERAGDRELHLQMQERSPGKRELLKSSSSLFPAARTRENTDGEMGDRREIFMENLTRNR